MSSTTSTTGKIGRGGGSQSRRGGRGYRGQHGRGRLNCKDRTEEIKEKNKTMTTEKRKKGVAHKMVTKAKPRVGDRTITKPVQTKCELLIEKPVRQKSSKIRSKKGGVFIRRECGRQQGRNDRGCRNRRRRNNGEGRGGADKRRGRKADKKGKINEAATHEEDMEEDGEEDWMSVRSCKTKYEEEGETKSRSKKGKRKTE